MRIAERRIGTTRRGCRDLGERVCVATLPRAAFAIESGFTASWFREAAAELSAAGMEFRITTDEFRIATIKFRITATSIRITGSGVRNTGTWRRITGSQLRITGTWLRITGTWISITTTRSGNAGSAICVTEISFRIAATAVGTPRHHYSVMRIRVRVMRRRPRRARIKMEGGLVYVRVMHRVFAWVAT